MLNLGKNLSNQAAHDALLQAKSVEIVRPLNFQ